jgi:hypothetical protein
MRKILFTFGLFIFVTSPAFAQSVKDKLLALSEGLNDPNPIIRIAALDDALADSSSTVRNYAMSQALASEDADLKSMALTKFFETRKQLTVIVKKPEILKAKEVAIGGDSELLERLRRDERGIYNTLYSYTPSILYTLKSFDSVSGQIKGFCMKSMKAPSESYTFTGSVVGDKITIEHVCSASYSNCNLEMQLSDDSKYIGKMRCTRESYPAVVELPLK